MGMDLVDFPVEKVVVVVDEIVGLEDCPLQVDQIGVEGLQLRIDALDTLEPLPHPVLLVEDEPHPQSGGKQRDEDLENEASQLSRPL